MEEYPSNSHKSRANDGEVAKSEKASEKKVEKVVSNEVIRRKKPLGKRFLETFFGGDAKGVFGYILYDVLIPAARDMAADAVSLGIERMLYGESRSSGRRIGIRSGGPNGYVNYNRYSDPLRRRDEPRSISRRARAQHDFDDIILSTRAEAEEVIDRLFDLISKYEVATVSDLYDLVGVSANYVDEKWGWTDIRGASVQRVRNGYLLDLPRPEYLE